MFKSFFGPFPDEPLLYSFDKILGLFHKFDSKLKCKDGEKQTDTAVSVVEKINEVCTETTTANDDVTVATGNDRTDATGNHTMDAAVTTDNGGVTDVTVMEKISLELVENSSQTSKRSPVECITVLDSDKVDESIEPPQELKHISTPKSILKTTSSMECNFPLSRICITKKSVHSSPVSGTKRANRFTKCSTKTFTQTKGFGDSVTVVQDKIERKLFRSDGRNRFESILKQETNHHNIQASRNTNNRMGRCNQNHNELTSRPQKAIKNVKLKDRKVTKTEWAVTRIYTFDDDSQTYEVMKKDKVLDRNGGIERIFAMAPNLTTVAYNPLKRDDKKPK